MSPPALRGVVFDLDDTLTDHRSLEAEVGEEVLRIVMGQFPGVDGQEFRRRHAANLDPLYERKLRGELTEPQFQKLRLGDALSPWGAPDERMLADYARAKQRFVEETRRADGAREAVAAVRAAGLGVGILTNGLTDLQLIKLERIGLLEDIDVFAASESVGAVKPEAEAFLAVAELMEAAPGELAMVGDNPVNDIVGALAAGFGHAVLIAHDEPPADLPAAALVVRRVIDAPGALGL